MDGSSGFACLLSAALAAACGSAAPAAETTITGVTVASADALVAAGSATTLTATVSGTGEFSSAVAWTLVRGIGALSATSGSTVSYTAPASATSDSLVEVSATSEQDSRFVGTLELGVAGGCTPAQEAASCGGIAIPPFCGQCPQGWYRCNHFACSGNSCFAQWCP